MLSALLLTVSAVVMNERSWDNWLFWHVCVVLNCVNMLIFFNRDADSESIFDCLLCNCQYVGYEQCKTSIRRIRASCLRVTELAKPVLYKSVYL